MRKYKQHGARRRARVGARALLVAAFAAPATALAKSRHHGSQHGSPDQPRHQREQRAPSALSTGQPIDRYTLSNGR